MGKYVKVFNTTSEYTNFITNKVDYVTPYVSLCKDALTTPHYQVYDPYNGYDYVEIGGLKWATMNVGATSITDYGLYFQWGDIQGYTSDQVGSSEGQKYFGWEDYKYGNGTSNPDDTDMTKYNDTDRKTVLEAVDDAVTATCGSNWRMPTSAEFQALIDATTNTWITNYQGSGVAGRLFTDKTDSSKVLFFPAAGCCINGSMSDIGNNGNYWTSSLNNILSVCQGRFLTFSNVDCYTTLSNRFVGYTVRGVIG